MTLHELITILQQFESATGPDILVYLLVTVGMPISVSGVQLAVRDQKPGIEIV